MSDVVFFDYWTRGSRHFLFLDKEFKSLGYTTLLVHAGSYRGERFKDHICYVDDICCHDLLLYKNSLIKMLKIEQPKLVVLLNNNTLDKIIVRACRLLNIPTIFIMHGVLALEDGFKESAAMLDSIFSIRDRLKRTFKYVNFIKQYLHAATLKSLWGLGDLEIFLYFMRLAYSPGKTAMGYWQYKDSKATMALVYTEYFKRIFVNKLGYQDEQVKVVGNYNIDSLFVKNQEVLAENLTSKYIVYIENGFSRKDYQVKGYAESLVFKEIQSINDIFKKYGYRLKVKLHPSSDYSELTALKGVENIDLIYNCDLESLITHSSLVLGRTSSVLMMALAIYKPIILLSIPPLEFKYSIYKTHGFGKCVSSYAELEQLVCDGTAFAADYLDARSADIQRFVGPFDGLASKRIFAEALSLMP